MELALAWQADKKLHCESCGHYLDESLDEGNLRTYEAHEVTCGGCMVMDLRRQALSEQETDMAGVRIYATRRHDRG
jgi:hypothetical protein